MKLAPGTVVSGEYRIGRVLGEGGFGAVYEAEQISTGKRRALKVLHPHYVSDPKSRMRFVEEAKVGGRIDSEHIVEVIGAGVDETREIAWLAMELLEGEDLDAHVRRAGPLAPASARELFLQLGHALGAAHARGIVHRDLKPENMFLAKARRRGAQMMVKVLDFGIAKSLEASRSAATATTAMGSPLFMAPEQSSVGAPIRAATDVWALGLIAFFALTGRYYWRAAAAAPIKVQALMAEMLVHPIDPPSRRASDLGIRIALPNGFDAWFARCVVRDATQRFASAEECVQALERVLAKHEMGHASTAAVQVVTPAPVVAPTEAMPPSVATPPYGGVSSDSPPVPDARAVPGSGRSRFMTIGLVFGALALVLSFGTTGYLLATRPDGPITATELADPAPAPEPAPEPEPESEPEPEPAAPGEPGTIVATSTGLSVDVAVDGVHRGRTPVEVQVAPGLHIVTVSHEHSEPRTYEVPVEPGQTQRIRIPVTVRRVPPTVPEQPVEPAGFGNLTINTMPWARVFVDGRDTGRNTPVRNVRVSAGQHDIGLQTNDGTMHHVSVTIRDGETERIVRQL